MDNSSYKFKYAHGGIQYTDEGIISMYPDLQKALHGEYVTFVVPIEFNEYETRSQYPNQKKSIISLLDYKKVPYRMIQEQVIDGLVKSIRFLINETSEEKLEIYYD